ncbi:hypothetical protein [Haloferula sp. BvORR071]|uniref:hypothetical protein n=1 Tax=Haloferula sp. BvORR071 TaxID=1396141 RepID=UPI00055222D5|nr:hypothetical protein [Haloferula sp. BvORR071]
MARQLSNMFRKRDQYTDGEFLNEAWSMSSGEASTPERIRLLQEALDSAVMAFLHGIAATKYASRLEKEKSPEFQAWINEQEPEEIDEDAAAWFAQWPSWEFIESLANIGVEERP